MAQERTGWRWWVSAIGVSLLAGAGVVLALVTMQCTMAGMR